MCGRVVFEVHVESHVSNVRRVGCGSIEEQVGDDAVDSALRGSSRVDARQLEQHRAPELGERVAAVELLRRAGRRRRSCRRPRRRAWSPPRAGCRDAGRRTRA